MSCELALLLGRPYDLPGCAASADPQMSCKPLAPGREEIQHENHRHPCVFHGIVGMDST